MVKIFLLIILSFVYNSFIVLSQPPRLTINNGTRLNANNNNMNIVFNSNVCIENNTPTANLMLNNTTVRFTGAGLQYIGGSQPIPFYNLRIAKTGSGVNLDVYLNQNAQVNNQIYMESGYLDLRNFIITLSSTATIQNEATDRRIKATNRPNYTTSGSEGFGTGYITTTRTDPSGNVANLGLDFTPVGGNLGSTEIRRGHLRLQGTGTYTGNWSAYRYYRIIPTTMRQLTINNFYYFVDGANPSPGIAELHVHPEANLQMFQQVQYWNGSTNPIYWEPRTTTTNPALDYVSSTTTNNPIMLNYILITLGSTTQPLPVEYLTFNGYCKDGKNVIFWQTASERNNLGFTVQKSSEAIQWQYLTFVEGNGNTNTISNYEIEDLEPHYPITYYRLIQTDFDGKSQTSSIISVQCYKQTYNEDFTTILNDGHLIIDIQGIPQNNYNLIITNVLGQIISNKNIVLNDVKQQIVVEKLLAAGIYHVSLVSKNNFISKPVFVN